MERILPTLPKGHPYDGKIEMGIDFEDKRMEVHLYTERLHMTSVKESDIEDYQKLFADPEVMRLYADGQPRSYERTALRIKDSWIPRWERGYPFSSLAIREQENDKFIGQIVAGDGDDMGFDAQKGLSGYSEMAYLLRKDCWNQGYGKEAAAPVVQLFIPSLVEKEYTVDTGVGGGEEKCLPLKWLTATSLVPKDDQDQDWNPASVKILTGLNFECLKTGDKFGNHRGYFGLDVSKKI